MEVAAGIVALLVLAVVLMVKPAYGERSRKLKETNPEQSAVLEESVAALLQRKLAEKQERHRAQFEGWDKKFLAELPLHEHRDYIEPALEDVKGDVTIEKTPDGRTASRTTLYAAADDQVYMIRKTYNPVSYQITHGDYAEDITGKWLRLKQERKDQRRRIKANRDGESARRLPAARAALPEIPLNELVRFYSPAEIADPASLSIDRFERLVGATLPGNCFGCGRFKKKTSLGYYICRDEYF